MKARRKDTGNGQVEAFMDRLQHPLRKEIDAVRAIIRAADGELTEGIKWNAPSFSHRGEDRITFNLHGQSSFRLVFHCGARARPLQQQLFKDTTGLLTWAAPDRAVATFTGMDDVAAKRAALLDTVRTWLRLTAA